ncbi:MAG: AsmA-like C-terminal region-containing protein [Pseudolabrys sp.]
MQTTLLGLAIALILALVTALVGPLLIDWGTYRALFEKEASRLVGVDVSVNGAIDARLLPSPRLTLHDIEIGAADKVRARGLTIEFALGSLMRGEWRATEMQLDGPQITLALDETGKLRAPGFAVAFDPDALSIEKLSVENGKVVLGDAANGASLTLDRFWFHGEARSLLGPFKGEGAFAVGGSLYPYRVSTGRYGDDGALKLRVNVDPVDRPLSLELDGMLGLAGAAPRFDGTMALTRPVGITGRAGAQGTRALTPPWRLSGKVKARAQSALIENLELQYGPEEQGVRLSGVADLAFGKRPLFNLILSGRQIDLDRAFATGEAGPAPPAATLRALAELTGGVFRPDFPVQLGIGIDQVTLGGASVQNLRGDVSSGGGVWNLDRLEFRAPGFTQVKLSGTLVAADTGVSFTGPAEVETGDARALAAWLEGRGDTGQGDLRPLRMRGDVVLGSEKIGIERLRAEFERKSIAGRLAYVFPAGGQKASLEAELNAPELDIDAALGFGKALVAGSKLARPHNMTIAADIGRATLAGFTARDASARVKVDGAGVEIDRLSIADFGGGAFSASGRIVTSGATPQGTMRVELDAPDLAPIVALMQRVAPETARALDVRAASMAPARLRAQFALEGSAPATRAKLAIDGSLGPMRVALETQGHVDPAAFTARDLDISGKLDSDDARQLLGVLGIDRVLAAGNGRGTFTFSARGPARGEMNVEARLAANGLDAAVGGTARLFGDARTATLRATVARANAAPLRGASGSGAALPVTYSGRIALAGSEVTFSEIDATAGNASLRGRLTLALAAPYRLNGRIDADNLDAAALVASAAGMPAAADRSAAWSWSREPFAGGAIGAVTGEVELQARRVALLPHLHARELRTTVRLAKDEMVFDDVAGALDGGRLAGRLALQASGGGIKARAKFALSNADAASVLAAGARPAVTGTLGLSAEIEGSGLSPVALVGSLHGTGKISLADGQLAALDPRAFETVTRAVDQGLVIDQTRIGDIVRRTLASGQLTIKRGEGVLAFNAGQVRLANVIAESRDADLALSGTLDLIDGSLDGRMVLSGKSEAANTHPDIHMALKGPFAAPVRSIDVSALTGWLTLRAVENQTRKLKAAEREAEEAARRREAEQAARKREAEQAARKLEASQTPSSVPPVSPPLMALPPREAPALAPSLPAPLVIGPLPVPGGKDQSGTSVGAQN